MMNIDLKFIAKIFYYVITFGLIIAIVPCCIYLHKDMTQESKYYGEIKTYNLYDDFNLYEYDVSDAVFYTNSDRSGYIYTTSYPVTSGFDGSKNQYNLLVNNQPCNNETLTAGILYGESTRSFLDAYGQVIQEVTLNIKFTFYAHSISLEIETITDAKGLSLLLEDIKFNDLKLRIIEGQYIATKTQSNQLLVTWLDSDGAVLNVGYYTVGQLLVLPTDPIRSGYIFLGWSPTPIDVVNKSMTYTAQYKVNDGNLLLEPVDFSLQKTTVTGMSVHISNSDTLARFADYPYIFRVQVVYHADKLKQDDFSIIDEVDMITDTSMTVSVGSDDVIYDNSQTSHIFTVNSMNITVNIRASVEYIDMEPIGIKGTSILIRALSNVSDPQFLYDHITIRIASIRTIDL